jgi:hypothetical protein
VDEEALREEAFLPDFREDEELELADAILLAVMGGALSSTSQLH